MGTPENPQIVEVSDARICEIFNNSQHATAIENGEYLEVPRDDDNEILLDATADAKGFPRGTQSQIRRYYRLEGRSRLVLVVEMHRYILPDGTVGASGRPSPKRVLIGDTMYRFSPKAEVDAGH